MFVASEAQDEVKWVWKPPIEKKDKNESNFESENVSVEKFKIIVSIISRPEGWNLGAF